MLNSHEQRNVRANNVNVTAMEVGVICLFNQMHGTQPVGTDLRYYA
jgi:hypothetical protein